MAVTTIRVLADDLTGAVDAAAPFSGFAGPMPVRWSGEPNSDRGSFAYDSETRRTIAVIAGATVRRLSALLVRSDIAFKKIDSLLRGHPAEEILACVSGGGFASAVVAPAFPAQNLITRRGVQFHRPDSNAPWQALDVDLAATFRARGMKTKVVRPGAACRGAGIFLCDAEENGDLTALWETAAEAARPTLWCGSAGLARALAGGAVRTALRFEGPLIVVIGSDHPMSARQADALSGHYRRLVATLERPGSEGSVMRSVEDRFKRGWDAAVAFRLPAMDAMAAQGIVNGLLGRLVVAIKPGAALVVGGEMLFRLASALGAEALTVEGELRPGIPCSRFVGGLWPNTPVISMSDAFGGPNALVELLADLRTMRP